MKKLLIFAVALGLVAAMSSSACAKENDSLLTKYTDIKHQATDLYKAVKTDVAAATEHVDLADTIHYRPT